MRWARLQLPLLTRAEVAHAADVIEDLADQLDDIAWDPALMEQRWRPWNVETDMAIEAHYLVRIAGIGELRKEV